LGWHREAPCFASQSFPETSASQDRNCQADRLHLNTEIDDRMKSYGRQSGKGCGRNWL
jgi:hypothetical protein